MSGSVLQQTNHKTNNAWLLILLTPIIYTDCWHCLVVKVGNPV